MNLSCKNCKSDKVLYDHENCDVICTSCGLVIQFEPVVDSIMGIGVKHRLSVPYRKINHFNQILLAWSRSCVSIPEDILSVVYDSYKTTHPKPTRPDDLTKRDVLRVLRSLILPYNLQLKYKSNKFKKTLLVRLVDRKQYSLRWWLIKDYILKKEDKKYRPTLPPDDLIMLIKDAFMRLVVPFTYIRHLDECAGHQRCHIKGCRYSMPNAYFIIVKIIKMIDSDLYKKFKADFPQISDDKREKLKEYWRAMTKWLNWPYNFYHAMYSEYGHLKLVKAHRERMESSD